MDKINKIEVMQRLTSYVHDLFLSKTAKNWVNEICKQETNRWYSLIVELDKHNCSTITIEKFGEPIYSKFVYQCIPSPNFSTTNEIMVLFTISGWLWHSVIYHIPKES